MPSAARVVDAGRGWPWALVARRVERLLGRGTRGFGSRAAGRGRADARLGAGGEMRGERETPGERSKKPGGGHSTTAGKRSARLRRSKQREETREEAPCGPTCHRKKGE